MKAQVIFYSALAFLLDLVASIPYAEDLQRYSSPYQTRPSLESTNPQRPYQNLGQTPNDPYNGAYNNPAPQFQKQELPRINLDNYFARNQQLYLNKGPPLIQPEVSKERYVNQQRIPNEYYTNNFQEPILHSQNDNWKGANAQINGNEPNKIGYPEVSVQERDTSYRYHPQQVIQNNRYPENFRNKVKESPSPADTYPVRPIPIAYNENQGVVENGPLHSKSPKKPNNEPLSIDNIPQINSRPEVLTEESFAPSIPSVPTRNIYLGSDVLKRVDDHYRQVEPVEEHQIPIVPSQPNHVNHFENGAPLSASERHLARAGNPVEQKAEPQVQSKSNVERIFSHPRIQKVLSTTKHKKRYLVVYPNGKIEHVDNLETIAKQHPNYVLVNAGDIVPNTTRNENVENKSLVPAPSTPVPENNKTKNEHATTVKKTFPSFSYEPSSFEVESIVKKPSSHVPEAVLTSTPATLAPTSTSGPVKSTTDPATIAQTTSITSVESPPQTVAVAFAPNATAIASAPYVTPIAPAHQAATTASTPRAPSIPQAQSTPHTPPAQSTSSTSTDLYALVEATTPKSQAQTATPVSLPQSAAPNPPETTATATSPSSPKNIQLSEIEIDKEVLPPNLHNDTESAVKQPNKVLETTSSVETESTSLNATSAETPPAVPTLSENTTSHSIPDIESLQPSTPNNVKVTPTLDPVTESTLQPNETAVIIDMTVSVVKIKDQPQKATTGSDISTEGPLVVPVLYDPNDESPNNIDEFILNEASNNFVPNPDEKVPDLGNSDVVASVSHDPVIWFRTSDPNFWQKLTNKTTGLDVIYFFQIHNQPKIVRDSKTTVFPNGTILEEFTETSWEFEGADPKVKKTTKLTNPEDL